MAKKAAQFMPNLFEPQSEPQETSSAPPVAKIEAPCPRCGGKSLVSVRPVESGGTRYCPVCPGPDGCYYFTPGEAEAVAIEVLTDEHARFESPTEFLAPREALVQESFLEDGHEIAETPSEEIPWKEYIRQVQLFFNKEGFEEFEKLLKHLSASYKTENPTDTVVEAMRHEKNRLDV